MPIKSDNTSRRPLPIKIGDVFGRLTVIDRIKQPKTALRKDKRKIWLCRCECGTVKLLAGSEMYYGKTRSCGCLQLEKLAEGRPPVEQDVEKLAIRNFISKYKFSAKDRGHFYDLSFNDIKNIIFKPCYYCGKPPNNKYAITSGNRDITVLTSGIDRVDNSKGYTIDNCVPCCKECNWEKKYVSMNIARKMMEFENEHKCTC